MVPVMSYYEEDTESNLGITQQTMFATEEPSFGPTSRNYPLIRNKHLPILFDFSIVFALLNSDFSDPTSRSSVQHQETTLS